jgi:tetratricopeptide (TPR) repeat protein
MSIRPVQAYYAEEKQDWKSAVAFLYERIGAEDIIIQMLVWPQEALGYYWKRYYPDEPMEFYNPFQVDEDDFPADVWWVFSLSSGNSPPRKHNKLQRLLGDAFEVSRFYQVAIVHREMEIQDLVDYSGVADQLISAQAEVDNAARRDLYSGRLVRLWQGLAETWADAGRYEQAIVAYERAIELAPFREGFFVRLAQVYHAIGQPDIALVNLQQAVDVAPDQAWPRRVLADTYRSLGQLDLAIATYQEVLQLAPESAEAHLGLGLAYEAQGMTEGAIHEYHIVVEMAPESGPGQRAQQKLDAYDQ